MKSEQEHADGDRSPSHSILQHLNRSFHFSLYRSGQYYLNKGKRLSIVQSKVVSLKVILTKY